MLSNLLDPFTFVLSRLKYAQKFILISILFAAPLALLFGLWLAGTLAKIQVEVSLPFILSLQQHRGQTNAFLNGGGADSESKLTETAKHANEDAAAIGLDVQRSGLSESAETWKTMTAATQQQLAALEEIGSAAGGLNDMATGLQNDLGFFRLSEPQGKIS